METLETERQRVEEKVRKLSSAVEQSIDGIAIGDLEPKLTYVNSAFAWMHGYSPEEMIGMPVVSLHNEEQMDKYQRSMAQIKTQGSWIGEIGHVRKDGTPFPTFMCATLLKDDDGKPTGILALVRDITEQKQAELGLKESQERYRTLIENLPQKIFHKDRKSVYISCNANYAQDLGVRPIEIIGKTDFDFYPKDLAEKYRADDRRVIESGQVEIIEERYIQHGEERLVQTFKAPIKDSEGNVTGVLGIFHDITDRKRMEEALRESEEKLSLMFESVSEGIIVTDLGGNIIQLNEAAVRMAGCDDKKELISRSAFDFIAEEDRARAMENLKRTLEHGFRSAVQYTLVRKDGGRYTAELNAALMRDKSGSPVGFVAVITDITERKQVEETLREGEHKYRVLFESTLDGMLVMDAEMMKIVLANQAVARMYGFDSPEDAIGLNLLDFIPLEDRERVIKIMAEDMFEKDLRQVNEFRTITKDGREIWINALGTRVEYQGRLAGLISLRDITEHKRAEKELRESEQRYRLLAENVTDLIWVTDMNLRPTYLSPSITRLLGYSVEEGMSLPVEKSLTPTSLQIAGKTFAKALTVKGKEEEERLRLQPLEVELYRKDGSTVWVEVTISFLRDKDGQPIGLLGVDRDISDRKKAEEALRESEHNYRVLFESTIDGMVVIDAETMKIVFANQAAARMSGFDSAEDVIGMNPLDSIPPEDRERVIKIMAEDMFEKDLRQVNEFRTITKDGREVWVSAVGTRIEYQGRLAGLISFRGITEHKRLEEMLRESERRYRLLAENATDVISCVDMNLRPTYMSPSITRLLGYTVEEAMARGFEGSLTPASREVVIDAISREMAMEQKGQRGDARLRMRELEFYRKDGSTVWAEVMVSFLRDSEGRRVEILSVLRDITDRRKAEEALRTVIAQTVRINATATLAAGVAHELNNPMMGILNFAQYCLKHTSEDDRRYPVLQDIERETKRCAAIVSNLLTFSRTGREGEEEYRKDSLATVIDRVVRLLSYRIEREHVAVAHHIAEGTPEIWMKVNSMQQVFLNLMDNALDAIKDSQKKEIQVEVHGEGDFVQMTVADSGCGIAPENLGKIFTPFFTTKPPCQGTGLGLSISESIIREHGGKIICESKLGAGTRFRILLPIERKVEKETAR